MKSDAVYLHHILDAIGQVEDYTTGLSRESFLSDRMVQDAVVRQLEIIGEAARRISAERRKADLALPWKEMIGLRNRIVHDYLNINLQVIWEVIRLELPLLRAQIEAVLAGLE